MAEDKITLPPGAQQLLMQMQTFQQQLQNTAMQKEAITIQKMEIDKALEEMGKSKETELYKSVGPILIKSSKEEMTKELKEKTEMLDLGMKRMEKQEEKIKEKTKEIQDKLKAMLEKPSAKSAA